MKRCPECRRDYLDVTLIYCLDDGSALLDGPASGSGMRDEPATAIFHSTDPPGETATRRQIETTAEPQRQESETWKVQRPAAGQAAKPLVGVAIGVLLLVGGYFGARYFMTSNSGQIESIAVMPFVNESGVADVEYLSDGMTETLINILSEVPSLSVKSRPAVFRFKGRETAPQTLASELNVQAILFGRLTLKGNELTLFLSLIDPQTENQIWGKQYGRKLSDLVALQSEIGRDVAHSLEDRLTAAAEDSLSKNYSKKGDAYRLYLLGDYYWAKFTKEGLRQAEKHYEEAIAIDPNYALAYAGLANTYSVLGVNGHVSSAEAAPKVRVAAERAFELAPQLAESHVALGAYKMFFEWDLDGAENLFRKAMALDRDYAVPHELLAYVQRARGRHEDAIGEAKRANELDPLNLLMLGDIAVCYRFAGQREQALEINKRLLEMDPNFADTRFENGLLLAEVGDHEAAVREITKGLALSGNSSKIKSGLGIVHARAGDHAKAKKVIDELLAESKEKYVSPMDIALIYSAMNDRDKAFDWLEKAYQERTPWMFELNVTPEFASIKDDARFGDLLKRIGLIA